MKRLILAAIVVVTLAEPVPRSNELPTMCTLCKEAVDIVTRMLDKALPEIENVFKIQCTELLSFLPFGEMECLKIAHDNIPKIKKYLEAGTARETICPKLKAC